MDNYDYFDQEQTKKTVLHVIELSKKYLQARREASENKTNWELLVASNMERLREQKSNLGVETANLMMLETASEEEKYWYKTWKKSEGEYKGLERLISSYESKVSYTQSIIKHHLKMGG